MRISATTVPAVPSRRAGGSGYPARRGRRGGLMAVTVGLSLVTATACGSSTSLPGGHTIGVPSVSVPSVPKLPAVDLSRTDPASARRALCTVTDYWLRADSATKELLRPAVEKVIAHYEAGTDEATRVVARTARTLVAADSSSAAQKRSAWNALCSST